MSARFSHGGSRDPTGGTRRSDGEPGAEGGRALPGRQGHPHAHGSNDLHGPRHATGPGDEQESGAGRRGRSGIPGSEGVDPDVFAEIYQKQAPWDLGRPQPEVVRLLEGHRFTGPVLDVGCGTGENAILLALTGYEVTAVDLVPAAIEQARAAAEERDVEVDWRIGDALDLPKLVAGRRFATILDAALFHVFSDDDRIRYAAALAEVVEPAGHLHVIVFSEREGGEGGPRRVSRAELEAAFATGWHLEEMVEARYHLCGRDDGARAWRGTWRRHGVNTRWG